MVVFSPLVFFFRFFVYTCFLVELFFVFFFSKNFLFILLFIFVYFAVFKTLKFFSFQSRQHVNSIKCLFRLTWWSLFLASISTNNWHFFFTENFYFLQKITVLALSSSLLFCFDIFSFSLRLGLLQKLILTKIGHLHLTFKSRS
jgi:hypothetical protein